MRTQHSPKATLVSAAIAICALTIMSGRPVKAFPLAISHAAFTTPTDDAKTPPGWIQFCGEHPEDCKSDGKDVDVTLTDSNFAELDRVNRSVNSKIKPITDWKHWHVRDKWSYPDDGRGDCEDYALLKRKTLMQAGWPSGALLITVVRARNGEGHAVLTVHTDKGDYVLDNQSSHVLPWKKTPYHYVKRQIPSDPNTWVYIDGIRETPVVAATN